MNRKLVGLAAAACLTLAGCAANQSGEQNMEDAKVTEGVTPEATPDPTKAPDPTPTSEPEKAYSLVKVDETKTYQTIESFGTSGAWWSQYVGGWDEPYGDDTEAVRDKIARWLYSEESGIGLTSYRYNIGAGSAHTNNGIYWDEARRAECFLKPNGEYDFTRDENAVWFLKKVVELGAEEIILFCNSPLESLTVNGKAQMSEKGVPNLAPENYGAFADYCFDVAEYFISEGIPVKFISPINEPQWDWLEGQEGCHYEPDEVVALLRVFVEKIAEREVLAGVEISGPESGEWGGRTIEYNEAIMQDEVLGKYFTCMDNHSYWSDANAKEKYRKWKDANYPDLKLRTSEWCEMVNGKDYTMDSAFNMLDEIYEDLTILDVVSWQNWVAVAPGDYRDGLIYVNKSKKACRDAKRLWAYGNLTRYVRPGYTRVEVSNAYTDIYKMRSLCFTGVNEDGQEEMVFVFINREGEKNFRLGLTNPEKYCNYQVVTTSEERSLEGIEDGVYTSDTVITVEAESITTVILTGK